jgi:hypothetical protein
MLDFANQFADVAQLAEQPPRKWQVVSSNLTVGSRYPPRFGGSYGDRTQLDDGL